LSGRQAVDKVSCVVQELSPEVLAEIDKDTHRTFPGHTW
jgi:hypothetical protein